MDRRTFSLSAIGALVSTLTACGGGGGGGTTQVVADNIVPAKDNSAVVQPSVASVELASPTSLPKGTVFLQTVAATDGDPEAAPGQANFWDLRTSLALGDGYNNQFASALNLGVSSGDTVLAFPADQTHTGLTAYGPELGAADGVKTVSFVGAGNAHLHPVRGARLQQTLDLTNATGTISLTWTSAYSAAAFAISPECFADEPFSWKVVLRDGAGTLLKTLFSYDQNDAASSSPSPGIGTDGIGDLSAHAGQTVVLSFEHDSPAYGSQVSSVSVTDGAGNQYVINGNFADSNGWTVPAVKVSQNVQSAPRPLHGLNVRRMFYTQPNALWGRWTDCFENPTPNPVSVVVSYDSTLGSGGRGVIYNTPGANGKALTSWDGSTGNEDGTRDRDIGMVFGSGVTKSVDGSANIKFTHTVSVPAGGSVALVNFIILSGKDTGQTVPADINARATEVDLLAADIANNFRTNFAYQRGMMQAQLDTLKNF